MAVAATAIWRVRTGGDPLNGGAYDGASYPGGTDYSQQDAAVLSRSDFAAASNSTTLTCGGGFTAAMVGNAIQISSGTNATPGFFFVSAYVSSTTVVLDRSPTTGDAMSAAVGRVGGGLAHFRTVTDNNQATGAKVAPGNTVYVRGSGSPNPSTVDYTVTDWYPTVGDSTGRLTLKGENGRPLIAIAGLTFYQFSGLTLDTLAFVMTGNAPNWDYGVFNGSGFCMVDCSVDQAGFDTQIATGGLVSNCEIFSSVAGSSTNYAFRMQSYDFSIIGCNIHDVVGNGIELGGNNFGRVLNNVIANCHGDGVYCGDTFDGVNYTLYVIGNTIVGNTGSGINFTDTSGAQIGGVYAWNNLIAYHTGVGSAGIKIGGTTATNDARAALIDGNVFYANASHVSGMALGPRSVVLASDPFVDAAAENFALTPALAAGTAPFPGVPMQSLSGKSALDPGAIQRVEAGSGTSTPVVSTGNYYVG